MATTFGWIEKLCVPRWENKAPYYSAHNETFTNGHHWNGIQTPARPAGKEWKIKFSSGVVGNPVRSSHMEFDLKNLKVPLLN